MNTQITLAELLQRANAGEPGAQFSYANHLNQQGHAQEAVTWFARAAQSGHGQACLFYAAALAYGQFIPADIAAAHQILKVGADHGSHLCRSTLASLTAQGFGGKPDWSHAIQIAMKGAKKGDRSTIRQFGLLCVLQGQSELGEDLLSNAAELGDVIAQASLLRIGLEHGQQPQEAESWLANLLRVEYPVRDQLEKVRDLPVANNTIRKTKKTNWSAVGNLLKHPPQRPEQTSTELLSEPKASLLENVIPRVICDYIIALSRPVLKPAEIIDPTSLERRADPYRTGLTMTFDPFGQDLVMCAMDRLLTSFANVRFDRGEMIGVLFYGPGQEYRPHYDCFVDSELADGNELLKGGQRVKTVLLTLNDEYEGGGTSFITKSMTVKPPAGSVLVFNNVNSDGTADKNSLHAGLPVEEGFRWLASKWIREKTYKML